MTESPRPTLWRPYATIALLVVLVGCYVYSAGGLGSPDAPTLMKLGARKANGGFPQAPWRLLASVFLHANWWHLLSNVIVLGAWGACLEKLLGRLEMVALFLLAGVWGSLASDVYGLSVLALGASGAVFAMVAAVLVLSTLARDWPQWQGDSRRWLQVSLAALALNAVSAAGFATMIQGARLDHWAHAGGALCGLLLALAPALAGAARRKPAFWAAAVLLTLVAVGVIVSRPATPFG